MTRIALLDGDVIAYRCSASAENDPVDISLERVDALIERIINEVGATGVEVYLSGDRNFRYDINPDYKANRKDKPRPRWLQPTREHMVLGWNARIADNIEADDEMGISQCTTDDDTVICTNDKDLLQIPGEHYNFVIEARHTISPLDGLRNFYIQMIMGDRSDNLFGYDGIARTKVPKFLEPTLAQILDMDNEWDMYHFTKGLYHEHDRDSVYEMNAHCLYIHKKQGDKWHVPNENVIRSSDQD